MPQLRHIEMTPRRLLIPNPSSNAFVIRNLGVLDGAHNFKIPNIKCLGKLESLHISCLYDFRGNLSLYKLTFPQTLQSLTLMMENDFEWEMMLEKIGSSPLLQKFNLSLGCFGTGKWEIFEGQFPCWESIRVLA